MGTEYQTGSRQQRPATVRAEFELGGATAQLRRIGVAYARAECEHHGLKLVRSSDVLRRPDVPRDQISYKPPMLGKTDRFVMVFRRRRA